MTKRDAQRSLQQLKRNGWKPNGLIRWARGGWSISVIGRDGWPIRLDTLEAVDDRLHAMVWDDDGQ